MDSAIQAQNLQEQIATLYIQICYSTEAINVNKESYKSSLENEERGKEMVKIGKMSQADLAQLTAQRAQDEYSIVESESNVKNYKRQLKELLKSPMMRLSTSWCQLLRMHRLSALSLA